MRIFVLGFAALALSAALAACSGEKSAALAPVKTDPAAVEKRVADLAAETFVGKATAAADIAAVRDALPPVVSLTWGGLTFDEVSKATVLTSVKLSPADLPDVGLSVDEVRLWDFDAEFAKARLAGQRLAETASLASRIELKGARIFGIETLMAPAMDAYMGAVEETVAAVDPSVPPIQTKLDSYEFSIGRILLADIVLRPYELKLARLPPENEFAEAMPVLQHLAAVTRTFAVDTMAAFDFKAQTAMTQMGQSVAFDMAAESYGARGIRGADSDASFMRNLTFDMALPTSGTIAAPTSMSGAVDYVSTEGTRLDKLYGYLARGEWPARTETDLLSIGLVTLQNERVAFDGATVFSIGELTIDARKWRWFLPTKMSFAMNDLVYDIKGFIDFADRMQTAELAVLAPAGEVSVSAPPSIDPAIMEMLTKYGLDKPSFDQLIAWDWNPDTGATVVDLVFGLDSYMRFDVKYEGGFPTFDGVSNLIPGGFETAKSEEIGALFESASTFKAVEFNLVDEGGLDKIFALAAEAGKSLPPQATGGVAIFANATPQGLRQTASAGAYMAADQMELQASGLKDLIAPFGAFIDKGGKVKLTLEPKAPLQLAAIGRQIETGEITPAQLVEQLNGKTVHTPPPANAN